MQARRWLKANSRAYWGGGGSRTASLQACMQTCKHASMQACKHASKHANMQACKYANMQACKHASMHASMQSCTGIYASMHQKRLQTSPEKAPRTPCGASLASLAASWGFFGGSGEHLGASWGVLGFLLKVLGPFWGSLGLLLDARATLLKSQEGRQTSHTSDEGVPNALKAVFDCQKKRKCQGIEA